jgi:hypothetical protein
MKDLELDPICRSMVHELIEDLKELYNVYAYS